MRAIFTIVYKNFFGIKSTRRISNLKINNENGKTESFTGFCFNKEAVRTFRVDRVVEIRDELDNVYDVEKFFKIKLTHSETREDIIKFEVNQRIHIDYRDASGNLTSRSVDVKYFEIRNENENYISGYCLLRKAPKTFKINNILKMIDDQGEIVVEPLEFFNKFKKAA